MARLRGFPWITAAICVPALVLLVAVSLGWRPGDMADAGPLDLAQALHVVSLGARSTPLVADADERWRLLTAHFVHTSWLHLAFNLAFLFPVGAALEQVVRRRDYATLVVVAMVGSALSSLLLTPQVSAGASGIVFGILGAAVVTGVRHRARLGPRIRHHFGLWVLPFLLVTLGITLGNPAVDHGSHLGGLMAGLLYAPFMRLQLPSAIERSSPVNVLALSLCALTLLVAPAVAREGAPVRVPLRQGWGAARPAAWAPRTGILGEQEWITAGGAVVLAADEIRTRSGDLATWYLDHRLRPLEASRHATQPIELPCPPAAGLPEGVTHLRFGFRREQTPMVRDVYFLPGPPGATSLGVMSLEVPRAWAQRYDETRGALVESLRKWRGDPPESTRVSVAALE